MTRKRFSEENIMGILRQIDLDLASGGAIETAVRFAGISDATYYEWRKMQGGLEASVADFEGYGEGECPIEADCYLHPVVSIYL